MKLVYDVKYTTAAKDNPRGIDIKCGKAIAKQGKSELVRTWAGDYRRQEISVTPEYHKEQITDSETKEQYEVDVDNREEVAAEIVKSLGKIANYQVKVHCCHHDEKINRPCTPWQVVAEKGEIPEEQDEYIIPPDGRPERTASNL